MKDKLSFVEIHKLLNDPNIPELPEMRISIIRNVILEPIEPYLRYEAFRMGFNATIKFGEYDSIFQETVGGSKELFNSSIDCVIVFMTLDTLSWSIARNFSGCTPDQIKAEIERIHDIIVNVLNGIRRQTKAMILWQGFEAPVSPSYGIYDSQVENGQLGTIRALNGVLRAKLHDTPNAYYVDSNLCLSRIGADKFYDLRYWHIGRAPYSKEAFKEIASENFKFIRPLKGKNKKCLVLDCDNTLWGGIIGEDGLPGIKLGKTYPGSPYYEFQQEIVNLYNRGVIIALCSKNNEEDVWEVFRKHPDMVLKEEHIATAQINWNDKAANLRQIALDLNIGLDSMVFIDDSEFEINLIREVIPEVKTIHLAKDKSVEYRNMLSTCGLFDTLIISEEDKKRGAMYKAETGRKRLQAQITDMETYYKSLGMIVEVSFTNEFSIPRIAQQTQKTNQFNLTTRRYSEADIKAFSDNHNADVISLRLKDKFGDEGIVGTCILKYENNKATIDTFLLSCRVLGRGVEDVFIIQALKLAKKRGCKMVIGEYFATRKNAQVEHFYSGQGFKELDEVTGMAEKSYVYNLEEGLKSEPEFFKKVISEIDNGKED